MSAICAGCRRAIATGQPFVLWGTEVFHRTSSCQSRIPTSEGTQQKLEIQKLKEELLHERALGAQARVLAQNAQFDLKRVTARAEKAEVDLQSLREQHAVDDVTRREAAARLQQLSRAQRAAAGDIETLGVEIRQLRSAVADRDAEITRLRNELLKYATDKIPLPEKTDLRDDTEIRFSLLEIDEK